MSEIIRTQVEIIEARDKWLEATKQAEEWALGRGDADGPIYRSLLRHASDMLERYLGMLNQDHYGPDGKIRYVAIAY